MTCDRALPTWGRGALYRDVLELPTVAGDASPFTSAQLLQREFGMQTFAGESPGFTTAGDQDGPLILVTDGGSGSPPATISHPPVPWP